MLHTVINVSWIRASAFKWKKWVWKMKDFHWATVQISLNLSKREGGGGRKSFLYVKINASENACYTQLHSTAWPQKPAPVMESVAKGKTLLQRTVEILTQRAACSEDGRFVCKLGCCCLVLQRLHNATGAFLFEHCIAVQKSSSKLHARWLTVLHNLCFYLFNRSGVLVFTGSC